MPADAGDPLDLAGLEPAFIDHQVKSKDTKAKASAKAAAQTELDAQKEARLAAREKRLGAGGAATASASSDPKVPLPPPPLEVDKSSLLDQVTAYREKFPHIKKRNNVSVKSSAEDILDELHYIEMQLGSRQDGSFGGMLLHGSMVAVETLTRDVWNPLGLNLTGLAKVTKDNMPEFQPILDELMIKYGTGLYMSPETRLVIAVGAMCVTVHSANSGDPRLAHALEKMNQPVSTKVGKDL